MVNGPCGRNLSLRWTSSVTLQMVIYVQIVDFLLLLQQRMMFYIIVLDVATKIMGMEVGYRHGMFVLTAVEGRFWRNRVAGVYWMEIVIVVVEHGRCRTCNGSGQVERQVPCQSHQLNKKHYYCVSSSKHGNDVSQYH